MRWNTLPLDDPLDGRPPAQDVAVRRVGDVGDRDTLVVDDSGTVLASACGLRAASRVRNSRPILSPLIPEATT